MITTKEFCNLTVDTPVWYHEIKCWIDAIYTGGFAKENKGKRLRIVPFERVTHKTKLKVLMPSNGNWINIEDEALSLTKPPEKITWRNIKANIKNGINLNKHNKLMRLLMEGNTLMLRTPSTDHYIYAYNGEILKENGTKNYSITHAMMSINSHNNWYIK